MIHLAKTEQG